MQNLEREQNAQFVFVDGEETVYIPANFLVLPDGKIFMAKGSPKTEDKIKEVFGEHRVITTKEPIPLSLKKGYGLRCLTNTIYGLKKTY